MRIAQRSATGRSPPLPGQPGMNGLDLLLARWLNGNDTHCSASLHRSAECPMNRTVAKVLPLMLLSEFVSSPWWASFVSSPWANRNSARGPGRASCSSTPHAPWCWAPDPGHTWFERVDELDPVRHERPPALVRPDPQWCSFPWCLPHPHLLQAFHPFRDQLLQHLHIHIIQAFDVEAALARGVLAEPGEQRGVLLEPGQNVQR